jgi:hypothetical protein
MLAVAVVAIGCGRIGFDRPQGGTGGPDGGDTGDGGQGLITTPFLDCDGIDDGVEVVLPATFAVGTIELRARVVDPDAAGIGEHELITVSRSSAPGVLDGLRLIANEVPPSIAAPDPVATDGTRLDMFETIDGTTNTGVAGPTRVEPKWMHLAMVYDPQLAKFDHYIDGKRDGTPITLQLTAIDAFDLCGNASGKRIAAEVDWVRISSSVRYTADFTPSVGQPLLDGATLSLLDFDAGTVTDLRAANTVRASGGVRVVAP